VPLNARTKPWPKQANGETGEPVDRPKEGEAWLVCDDSAEAACPLPLDQFEVTPLFTSPFRRRRHRHNLPRPYSTARRICFLTEAGNRGAL
jgi:hypothetical protein